MFKCIHARRSQICASKIVLNVHPGTGKTTTIAKLLSLLYCATPRYYTPSRLRAIRAPSFRTLICAASNAGVDQILSRLRKEGVLDLNLDSVTGSDHTTTSAYFMNALKSLHEKLSNHEITYIFLFSSSSIRPPSNQVQTIDIDESDLRMIRVGATDNCDAKMFPLQY